MFKKPVKVSAQNQLSGKDKKTIKAKIIDNWNQNCVEKMLALNDKIISCKISGSKMLIYNGDQYPLFIDGTGKHNYFPSLYVAAAYQPLVKTLTLNEGVETYIYNGANLMWPGVRNYQGLGDFQKDEVVGIRNSKGQIIAIGAMGISKKELTDTSGVATYILHYYGDKLWQMGPKTYPQVIVPLEVQKKNQLPKEQIKKQQQSAKTQQQNQGNKKQVNQKKQSKTSKRQKQPSLSPPKKQQVPSEQSSDDQVDFMNLVHTKTQPKGRAIQMEKKSNLKNAFIEDQNQELNKKKKKHNLPTSQPAGKKGAKKKRGEQEIEDQDMIQEQEQKPKDAKKGGKKKPTQKAGKKDKRQESQDQQKAQQEDEESQQKSQHKSVINTKLMDQYFKESMLNAIKLTKIESELPIDSGRFYMDYMLLARPEGVKLQIKDSSYKKIGKFFDDMSKKKLIQYKHPKDKKAQGAQITKIFWENQQIKNHLPTVKKLASKQEQEKVEDHSKVKLKLSKTVNLQTVYKPSQQLFDNVLKKPLNLMPEHSDEQVTDKQQIEYVSEKQLREKIQKYINKVNQNNKKKEPKQGAKKVEYTEKHIMIDYNKHPFVQSLLKKQIQAYEQNKQKDDILKHQSGSQEEEDDKKKKKNKKGAPKQGLFKVQRHYLVDKLMNKATPYYHVYDKQTGLDKFKQGQFKGLQIIAEKSNNKNITKIIGLQLFITPKQEADAQIHGLAHALQTKFACSVNVQNLPGKNAGKQIIVHGGFLDQLEQMFENQYQLPSKFITTLNKLEKKKKH